MDPFRALISVHACLLGRIPVGISTLTNDSRGSSQSEVVSRVASRERAPAAMDHVKSARVVTKSIIQCGTLVQG